MGLLEKIKVWKTNYYINSKLVDLFTNQGENALNPISVIESVHEPGNMDSHVPEKPDLGT